MFQISSIYDLYVTKMSFLYQDMSELGVLTPFYLPAYTIPESALQVYGSLAISLGPVVVCEVVQCGIVLFGVERSRDLFREPSGNRETQEDCLFSSWPRPQSYGTMCT